MNQLTLQTSVIPLPNSMHELRVQGRLYHPHWLAFLLSGLAGHKISVVSGKAVRDADHEWNAILLLDFRQSVAIPDQVDYKLLTEKPAHMDTSAIQLSSFHISRRTDKALEVHLLGPDQLGFVGRFLMKISLLGLYPSEVRIATSAGQISDIITLNGLAGSAPDDAQQESLWTMLCSLQK